MNGIDIGESMIVPEFLKKGDTIGVSAPSYSASEEKDGIRFANARKKLKDAGFNTFFTDDVFGYGEGDERAPADIRARQLESLFINDRIRAFVSAKGGDFGHEILPILNWDIIESHPKWMQGYSDNTSILLKTTVEHDIETIYCGNFGDFGMDIWHRSISDNLAFLEGKLSEQESFDYHETKFHDRVTQLEGIYDDELTIWDSVSGNVRFRGRLLGGCMDILAAFANDNSLDVKLFNDRYREGIVWYMETFSMNDNEIRQMFKNMEHDGWFECLKGFVFGREMFYEGNGYKEMITNCISEFDVPIVFNADVGHKAPRMIFVNGAISNFSLNNGKCRVTYEN